jgi:NADPH:quinone reductase-like Zn-dependent oxidoreductase
MQSFPPPPCGQVAGLKPGNRVVPLAPAAGTWRSGGVFRAADWHAVPPGLPDAAAATLCIK